MYIYTIYTYSLSLSHTHTLSLSHTHTRTHTHTHRTWDLRSREARSLKTTIFTSSESAPRTRHTQYELPFTCGAFVLSVRDWVRDSFLCVCDSAYPPRVRLEYGIPSTYCLYCLLSVRVNVCMYVHINIYMYIYLYMYIYIICIYIYIYICIHTHILQCICMCIHKYEYTRTHTNTNTHILRKCAKNAAYYVLPFTCVGGSGLGFQGLGCMV